jgi:hypothetical protein
MITTGKIPISDPVVFPDQARPRHHFDAVTSFWSCAIAAAPDPGRAVRRAPRRRRPAARAIQDIGDDPTPRYHFDNTRLTALGATVREKHDDYA